MTGMAICRMAVMQRITGRIGKNGMQKGSMHMNDRKMVLDGMMGLVVGDALGCPVQFLDREELRERGAVTEMEGYGTYNMPPGTWTDDSSMALATLASINERNGIDLRDIMERFLDWEFHGAYTPFGEAFDEGNTCSNAIYKYRDDHDLTTCGETDEYSNGNGALMRILPVCLYFIQKEGISDADALRQIHLATGLTHNHLRCHIASGLYYFMAKAIVAMAPEKAELKTCIQCGLEQGFAFYHTPESLAELMHFHRLRDLNEFFSLPEDEIESDGYVLHALEAAIWCLLHTNRFRDCLLRAVNLGDDTDTTAAIAGGLAGLYYHYEAMPQEWVNAIRRKAWIKRLCLQEL